MSSSEAKQLLSNMRPAVNVLMISTVFTTLLVPLFIAMLYFSTERTRRTPVHICALFTVCAGIAVGTWTSYESLHAILAPDKGLSPQAYEALAVAIPFTGWLVDIVLLCRVLAVFPPSQTKLSKLVLILTPPVVLKIIRVATWILFAVKFHHDTRGVQQVPDLGTAATDPDSVLLASDYLYVIATTADNAYASVLFLWKTRRQGLMKRMETVSGDWKQRVRTLFWLATSNFVFPVILNIVQLAVRIAGKGQDYYILVANTQFSIICAVFATVWSSSVSSEASSHTSVYITRHVTVHQTPVDLTNATITVPIDDLELPQRGSTNGDDKAVQSWSVESSA